MNELKTLIENSGGLKSLDQLLKTIADALNISVTQLQSNLPDYLAQIGRYGLIDNIVGGLYIGLFIGFLIGGLGCLSMFMWSESEKVRLKNKTYAIVALSPFLIVFILNTIAQILIYWASPQIYAIKYLKDMLGM